MNSDDHNLDHFVKAQESAYSTVLQELRRGQKCGHWMWFIFPQIIGLGESQTAKYYSIRALSEARAYGEHPILGARLEECAQVVLQLVGRSVHNIFGYPDELKFRSSMTLFAQALPNPKIYQQALMKYFEGVPDPRTLAILIELERG